MNKAKIGVGIVTYKRAEYFKTATLSVRRNLLGVTDEIIAYHDGTQPADYPKRSCNGVPVFYGHENKGVAHAKNWLIRELLARGCDYIFIMEDDMEIIDKMAIVGYLAAHRMTGIEHLTFAHHGPGNNGYDKVVGEQGPLVFYKAGVGSWCFYTAAILEQVGLMDEKFVNAWEHIEHTWRIMQYIGIPYGHYPDVVDSETWIREQPGAIENSSIGSQDNPERRKLIIDGLEYWKTKDPDFPAQHTLDYYSDLLQEMEQEEQ